ncbi:MAG: leucyl aminopeptidase family protein [Deltaproteobacteria bacterium]|jgi:leucyl aminopeptidase|nr:leucyl aminopeptidase family protein [Deltaproteobacteria bacterium]
MNFKYKSGHMNGPAKPGTAVFVTEGDTALEGRPELASFRRCLAPVLSGGAFKGGLQEGVSVFLSGEDTWVTMTGLGPSAELNEGRIIEAGADAASRLSSAGLKEAVVALPPLADFPQAKVLELLVTGASLALFKPAGYKSGEAPVQQLKSLTFQHLGTKDALERPQQAINRADLAAQSQLEARRLADMPPNMLYPESFAEEAKRVAMRAKLKITVWEAEKIAVEGAGGLLAVGAGSHRQPALVILEYPGRPSAKGLTALVGKGVTFDSGGLCIKPAENMGLMKSDMSGAAAVLAVTAAAAEMKIPEALVAVMPLAENMPGGGAYRPGDVVRMLGGQTVEVTNTDAEGRMILADALVVAQKYRPTRVIDIATLTGACQVALGPLVAGLFSTDDALASDIQRAGLASGEDFWRLPLYAPYSEDLKSETADFRHAGGRAGGAINAALFLQKFVKAPLPWAHLDIAGTARRTKGIPSCPEGATGFGVRTLLKLLLPD